MSGTNIKCSLDFFSETLLDSPKKILNVQKILHGFTITPLSERFSANTGSQQDGDDSLESFFILTKTVGIGNAKNENRQAVCLMVIRQESFSLQLPSGIPPYGPHWIGFPKRAGKATISIYRTGGEEN